VLSIVLTLAGLVAVFTLPIAQYPEVAPPTVLVTAVYPGANAQTVLDTVAAPIEQQVSGVENMLYMKSVNAADGSMSLSATFDLGTSVNLNQVNVQNRVSQALPLIPQVVSQQGVTVQTQSSSLMMVLSVYSPDERYDSTYIDNYTNLYVLDELKRVPGANRASVFGLPDIAMRVWLRPDRMAQLGISVQEVAAAIQSQNQTYPGKDRKRSSNWRRLWSLMWRPLSQSMKSVSEAMRPAAARS
jgi:multidrug efflux pump